MGCGISTAKLHIAATHPPKDKQSEEKVETPSPKPRLHTPPKMDIPRLSIPEEENNSQNLEIITPLCNESDSYSSHGSPGFRPCQEQNHDPKPKATASVEDSESESDYSTNEEW